MPAWIYLQCPTTVVVKSRRQLQDLPKIRER